MKTQILLLTTLIIFTGITTGFSGSGSGTSSDPYEITSCSELQEMENELGAHYELTENVDCSGFDYSSVGNKDSYFDGSLDGQGHEVKNLEINEDGEPDVGLIGFLDRDAEIKNVGVVNVDITGEDDVGGLVGHNIDGHISNSYSTGNINGYEDVGGLIGYNYQDGTVSKSYSTSNIRSESWDAGGLIGWNQGDVSYSYSTGSVEGGSYSGGLIGYSDMGGTVSDGYWDTQSSGQSGSSGGTGLTTSEMQGDSAESNMNGLDFSNTWCTRNNDYPGLDTLGQCNSPPTADFTSNSPVKTSEDFGLDASSSSDPDGDSLTYEWDTDNDGNYEKTGLTPRVSKSGDGNYEIGLRVNDGNGGTDSISKTVEVENRNPSVSLSASDETPLTGEEITLGANANDPDGSIESYNWNIGGSGSSVTNSWNDDGSQTVEVTATDNDGATATDSITINVKNRDPSASISYDPIDPLTDEEINFDASSSSDPDGSIQNYQWDWDNDGNYEENGQTASHSYPDDESYTVTLKLTDDDDASNTVEKTVNVSNRRPSASFSHDGPKLTGENINLDASDSTDPDGSVDQYAWDLDGDGSYDDASGETTPTSYPDNGNYSVGLRVTDNDGLTDSTSADISVRNRRPSAGFVFSKNDKSLDVDASEASDADGNIDSYEWDWDNDGTYEASGKKSSYIYSSGGVKNVTLKVTDDDGAESTVSETISINQDPQVEILNPENDSLGVPTSANLNASVDDPDGDNLNVTFYEDDGSIIRKSENVENGSYVTAEWKGLDRGSEYKWRVNVSDGEASKRSTKSSFTTVAKPDTPEILSPTGEQVDLNEDFRINVSHPTGQEMFVEAVLTDEDGFVDDFAASFNDTTITQFNPDLRYDESYNLSLEASVSDSNGTIYSSSNFEEFTTELSPEQLLETEVTNVDPDKPELVFSLDSSVSGLEVENSTGSPVGIISDPKEKESMHIPTSLEDDKRHQWTAEALAESGNRIINFNFTTVTVEIELDETVSKADSYRIYRSGTKDGNYTQITETTPQDGKLIDSSEGLKEGEIYCYKISALTEEGIESELSQPKCLESKVEVTEP